MQSSTHPQQEISLASRYLFLSMAITVVRMDIQNIQSGPFKIKEPYIELLHRMEHVARKERQELIQKMRKSNIEVIFLGKNDSFSSYLFRVNNYEWNRRYFNPAIRKEVERTLIRLMHLALQPSRDPLISYNRSADVQ